MNQQLTKPEESARDCYQDLKEMVPTAFPKKCPKCGRVYPDRQAFLTETIPVKDVASQEKSGLFSMDGIGSVAAVGVFRNCACKTTLLADFHDRRDTSEEGNQLRARFNSLLQQLCEQGIDKNEARRELRNALRGYNSDNLTTLLKKISSPARCSKPGPQSQSPGLDEISPPL